MIEVVTAIADGEEVSDTYDGLQVSFMTEPSGALVVMNGRRVWAAYAPGEWKKVRDDRQVAMEP